MLWHGILVKCAACLVVWAGFLLPTACWREKNVPHDATIDTEVDQVTIETGEEEISVPYPQLRIGQVDKLEIATWNLKNFPTSSYSSDLLADLIRSLDVDLIAVQEIADVSRFEEMLEGLSSYTAVLSGHVYSSLEMQQTGFVYRSNQIRLIASQRLFEGDSYAFVRPPFQVILELRRNDGSLFEFIAIVVHLKAYDQEEDRLRRKAACFKLKNYIDHLQHAEIMPYVVLLGDFNDRTTNRAEENIFLEFLADEAYVVTTLELEQAGGYSYIPWQRMLDHIVITYSLHQHLGYEFGLVLELEKRPDNFDYQRNLSDHRPVVNFLRR